MSAIEKVISGLTTVDEVMRVLHRNALRYRSPRDDRSEGKSGYIQKIW